MITKKELLPLMVERLLPILASRGFRYLKSQEIFQAKVLDIKIWMNIHLTYWPSGKYCDFSPFVSVRYERIARFIDNYSEKKADVYTPTLGFKSDDQLYEGQWVLREVDDLEKHIEKIEKYVKYILIPILDSCSNIDEVCRNVVSRDYDNFLSEYFRILFLFSYVGAYGDRSYIKEILQSIDKGRLDNSKCQLDPRAVSILLKMQEDVPEIHGLEKILLTRQSRGTR